MLPVQNYIGHFVEIWNQSPTHLPVFKKRYSPDEQKEREKYFSEFQQKINGLRSKRNVDGLRKSDPAKTFFPVFKSFLETVFDFEKEQLQIILSDEFKNVSKDFFYKAREFGPELSPEGIYQGMRNVWIMNGLQLMMNLPVEVTPSVFGYSMIYPYSDNLLDDPATSSDQKKEFSRRFDRRLHGEAVLAQNNIELKLFRLVEMFEKQYPRKKFPKVYESLYAIQKGQTNSIFLNNGHQMSGGEIQNICFEKGGTSVLADGYLVAGRLTAEQERALFGYGVYLQLLDDIQDVKEDSDAATRTMFTCRERNNRDEFVNKTVHFGRKALAEMHCFDGPEMETFLQLMNRSIETMIIESVGMNEGHFSKKYLVELEKFSPLRFEFVRKKRSQSKSQRFSLFKKYFEQAKPEQLIQL
jgi:hypothetical protein